MLLHRPGSSAPAEWGSRTEIAPTVAPHRNRRPAARAMTRTLSEPPDEPRTGSVPRTAATRVLSAVQRNPLLRIANTGKSAGAGRAGRAQRVFAVRVTVDLDDESVLEAPHRGAVFA